MRILDMLGAAGAGRGSSSPISSTRWRRSGSTASCSREGDTYQVESALRTLTAGGLFGAGPGAGTRKFSLPEPHTDYIFSVIGEEFGIIACLAIAILYHDDRRAGADPAAPRGGQVPRPRRRRPGLPVRAAGADQHGGQRPYRAVQGHDPAVHLLWRLVDDRAVDRLRPAARLHPPQPAISTARPMW